MPQHIKLHTDFDVTDTGVVRNFKEGLLPCKICGVIINSESEWIQCRRQQSNYETIIQIVSLRTQPYNIRTKAGKSDWTIEFDIEFADAYRLNGDALGLLKKDFNNVPLLTGLTEHKELPGAIIVSGADQNLRFETDEL